MVPSDVDIVLIVDDGFELEAKNRLARIGFDRVVGYLDHPLETFADHPESTTIASRLTATEFDRRRDALAELQIVDVRNPGEHQLGSIPGATSIPVSQLPSRVTELDPTLPTVVFCAGGYRSSVAASVLRAAGFSDVSDIIGGYGAWAHATGLTQGRTAARDWQIVSARPQRPVDATSDGATPNWKCETNRYRSPRMIVVRHSIGRSPTTPESLEEHRRLAAPHVQQRPLLRRRVEGRQPLPSRVRTQATAAIEFVVERGPLEVAVEQHARVGHRQPGPVERERIRPGEAQPLQEEQRRVGSETESVRDDGVGRLPQLAHHAALFDAGRLHRLEQAVQRAERLLELRPIDDGPPPTLAAEDPRLVQVPNRFAHGVAAHAELVDELAIGREAIVEIASVEPLLQHRLELRPERHRARSIQLHDTGLHDHISTCGDDVRNVRTTRLYRRDAVTAAVSDLEAGDVRLADAVALFRVVDAETLRRGRGTARRACPRPRCGGPPSAASPTSSRA